MNDDEFRKRGRELLEQESTEPLAWWWLSFADADLPEGQQFLGVVLVKATGFFTATIAASLIGCNPGGECKGLGPIPIDQWLPDGFTERLLTRAECAEFDRLMSAREPHP